MNDLKGFYKQFYDGEAGKDYVKQLAEMELQYQLQAYASKDLHEKAMLVERMYGLYLARTRLHDMSSPPTSTTASGGKVRS